MYKLLIVDDERIIADLLAELFQHREELDLDVFKAYSGREAMAILEQAKIDIVVSDVNMPGMTGIKLQEAATRLWPNCRFIFLTAYDYFANIQSALRNKAVDFVLKSESDEVLLCSVQKAVHSLDAEMETADYLAKAESSLQSAIPVLQQLLMQDIIDGEATDAAQIEKLFLEYGIGLDAYAPVLLLVGRVDKWETKKLRKYAYGVNKLSLEVLGGQCRAFAFSYDDYYVIWMIQPLPEGRASDAVRLAHGSTELLQKICKNIGGISVSMILADGFVQWHEVARKFKSMSNKLDSLFGLTSEMVVLEAEGPGDTFGKAADDATDPCRLNLSSRKINYMRLCLESVQQEEFSRTFDEFATELLGYANLPDTQKTEIILQLNLMFFTVISHKQLTEEVSPYYPLEQLITVEKEIDLAKRIRGYREIAQFLFMKQNVKNLSNMNAVFGSLRRYIHDNIAGDLSLHRLAGIVHFNPYYLSRLFKSVTNKSVSEYISEVKLEHACDLLSQTNRKVADIAIAVGYENQQNFTRFFKRHLNVSPLEYRESSRSTT